MEDNPDTMDPAPYFEYHFPYRLKLLRTFRMRGCHLPEGECPMDWSKDGDLISCAKDASIMALRFWLEFFNFEGKCARKCKKECNCDSFILEVKRKLHDDDVRIDIFVKQAEGIEISKDDKSTLGQVYKIGDKHVAHFTRRIDDRGPNDHILVAKASQIMEDLIERHLYLPLGKSLPPHFPAS